MPQPTGPRHALVEHLAVVARAQGTGARLELLDFPAQSERSVEGLARVAGLSIIIPTLNEAAGIVATLAPLQPLRAQGHEVIVVDGGSADGTLALAARLADQALTAASGRAIQMNAGAALARGQALVFLHADTLLPEGAATLIRETLARRRWGRFDVRIAGRPRLLRVVAILMNLRSRLTGIATGDQAIFVERSTFAAVGGFPDQPLMEDIELSKRLKRVGPPGCLRARVLTSGRRWEARGPWHTVLLMWQLRLDYWRGVPVKQLAERYQIHPKGKGRSDPQL
jgi:rSAM/selenodomain-associated transferase 2